MPNTNVEQVHNRTVGDRAVAIAGTINRAGSALNLTGMTVVFRMVADDGTVKVNSSAATVDDAASGQVSYTPAAADVDTAGTYWGWWVVTVTASGFTDHVPHDGRKFRIEIHPAE